MVKRLETLLRPVYAEQFDAFWPKLLQMLAHHQHTALRQEQTADWHQHLRMYVVYPDAFEHNERQDLTTLQLKIPTIARMGFNAIHILPFLHSPMIDGGFDISDYRQVRPELGGNQELLNTIAVARKHNIRVFMDLVLNHVSSKHNWFLQAINGNKYYRNFFLNQAKTPIVRKKYTNSEGMWAQYECGNQQSDIRVIFPHFAGPIPHWHQAPDGHWYYHTFYTHQPDLNWLNPDVFLAMTEVILEWALLGLNFRLDALTFLAKDITKGEIESNPRLFKILEALRIIVRQISPDTVFLIETCQKTEIIMKYFGQGDNIVADLAYNFPLSSAIWHTIITRNTSYLWQVIQETYQHLPSWSGWITFLRNHDELTLEFIPPVQSQIIYDGLAPKGLPFREGLGIAGRTASFLNNDPDQIIMAYSLLCSLPGSPALIYGDEVGKPNDPDYLETITIRKRRTLSIPQLAADARDINRGVISAADENTPHARLLCEKLAGLINIRKQYSRFFTQPPTPLSSPTSLLAAEYTLKGEVLRVWVNLSAKPQVVESVPNGEVIYATDEAEYAEQHLSLGPYAACWMIE